MSSLSQAADSLFAPISASRPLLLEKFVLLLLAADIWSTRSGGASRYDADEFQLAHFGWLDALQPTPNETIYLATLVLTGLLSVTLAVANLGLVWRLALVVLYSYTWAMSRLDSYQHHYLLSWVLLCVAFFPTLRLSEVANTEKGRPLACAWAWRLLGLLIAMVYVWTSVAKLDDVWRSGAGLAQLSGAKNLLSPFAALFPGRLGVYAFAANATIVVELMIAAGYAVSALAADQSGRFTRLLSWVSWALAIALHAGFELAGLKIGWFSYWMIAAACVYFLPDPALQAVVQRIRKAWLRFIEMSRSLFPDEEKHPTTALGMLFPTIVLCLGIPRMIDLPGVGVAAAAAWAAAALHCVSRRSQKSLEIMVGLTLAVLLLFTCVLATGPQSQFYTYRLAQLQRRGDWEA
ncbi:MAG: HTTM domain-containing protein, partial [Planctomycetota bacterium]